MKPVMTRELALSLFDYRGDGVLLSKKTGEECGLVLDTGYVQVNIRRGEVVDKYFAHRIIWAMHHGDSPAQLCHADKVRSHNRIENLRVTPPSQNVKGRALKPGRSSKYVGVSIDPSMQRRKRWKAAINIDGKTVTLGRFLCETAAMLAYKKRATAELGEVA